MVMCQFLIGKVQLSMEENEINIKYDDMDVSVNSS